MSTEETLGVYNQYSFKQVDWSVVNECYETYRPVIFKEGFEFSPLAVMSEAEKAAMDRLAGNLGISYRLNVGIYHHDDLVGWSFGWQDKAYSYYMTNTGILPEHQGKGIYSALLPLMLERLEREGFQIVHSRHRMTSNQVLVPKLKAGFVITGFELTDMFGMLVQLSWFANPTRRQILDVRAGELRPDATLKQLLNL